MSTFAVMITSDDMTNTHISVHEVYGFPKESGRAETLRVVKPIHYIVQLTAYYDMTSKEKIKVYCYNMESICFAKEKWIQRTLKWADERNIDLKMITKDLLNRHGHMFLVEHITSHQEKSTK